MAKKILSVPKVSFVKGQYNNQLKKYFWIEIKNEKPELVTGTLADWKLAIVKQLEDALKTITE